MPKKSNDRPRVEHMLAALDEIRFLTEALRAIIASLGDDHELPPLSKRFEPTSPRPSRTRHITGGVPGCGPDDDDDDDPHDAPPTPDPTPRPSKKKKKAGKRRPRPTP